MIIELESIFNNDGSSYEFDYELSLSHISVSGVNPLKSPVKVKGMVKNNTGIVTLSANVELIYSAFCDRCAEATEKTYNYDFSHNLIASLSNEDNDDFLVVSDMRLDLDELIEEDVNLELPTKFLCSEDCKGVCVMCGKNLNKGQCDCKKPIDPRLEGLLQFLE
ncbi:MAG: DUF177 domain-containing protein [Ruminococcaceae bacterium]|jgi:uncharacterized protein|nr:DUF177 domain-containing protein [Oscillospiraceae bacterium]